MKPHHVPQEHGRVLRPCACVSFPALTSVLADIRERHRQWRLALLAVFDVHSLGEPFVGEALAGDAVNEAIEPRQRMVFDIAFIEPEGKFVNVATKMFRAAW